MLSVFFVVIGLTGTSDDDKAAGALILLVTILTLSFLILPTYSALFMSLLFNLIRACIEDEENGFETNFCFRHCMEVLNSARLVVFLATCLTFVIRSSDQKTSIGINSRSTHPRQKLS